MAVNSSPIWETKNAYFNKSAVDYRVQTSDGRVLYSGHAVRKPGASLLPICINDIVADRLTQEPLEEGVTGMGGALENSFELIDDTGIVNSFDFRLDWSYDRHFNPDANLGVLSDPITGRVSSRQLLAFSKIGDEPVTSVSYIKKDGTTESADVDSVDAFNFFHHIPENTKAIMVNNRRFDVVEGCERFCLYYVNAYGGWDSLLIEGEAIRTDAYDRHIFSRDYNATYFLEGRSKENYQNNVKRSWELHTGWLVKDEASRMHHLLGSTMVYLYDFETEQMIPVIITDNECRYKDYHNNGNKLVEYTINVEVAQNYKRK